VVGTVVGIHDLLLFSGIDCTLAQGWLGPRGLDASQTHNSREQEIDRDGPE